MSQEYNSEGSFIEEEEEETESDWEPLLNHPNYEICKQFPYQIKKISSGRILKETVQSSGYLRVKLNGRDYLKHRLIGLQFIHNPDPKHLTQIDHISGDRTDNRIENLRWVSNKQNCNNKHIYKDRKVEFVEELPDNAVVVENYSRFEFEGLYFHGGLFYVDTENGDFRIVPTYIGQGKRRASLRDKYGIQRSIIYDKFLRDYGLN